MAICVVGVVLITLGYMVGRTRMRCHVIVENHFYLSLSPRSPHYSCSCTLSKFSSDLKTELKDEMTELKTELKAEIEKSSSQMEKSSSQMEKSLTELNSKFTTFNDSYISLKATSERLIVEVDNLERRR